MSGIPVLVDARAIDASGIGRFLKEVVARLARDGRVSSLVLLGSPERLRAFVDGVDSEIAVEITPFQHSFYSPGAQIEWPKVLRAHSSKSAVVFLPHYDGPLLGLPRRSVVTVQDLIHFKVPSAFPVAKRLAAGVLLNRVCRQAGHVVVTSKSTENDLHERLPFTRLKTSVVPLAVSSLFAPAREGHSGAGSSRPYEFPFLLCVGNRKRHKNHVAAVEALARLGTEFASLKLIVAGREYDGADAVTSRAQTLGVAERVLEISDPTDQELQALYEHAEVLVFPSLYEGFGLPVLEAMACGLPVIASNRSSIPEVVGKAAVLVDPTDHESLAGAVSNVLQDAKLRSTLVAEGKAQVAKFSWDATAASITDLLIRAGGEAGEPSSRPGHPAVDDLRSAEVNS